jgi:hypothetical protein
VTDSVHDTDADAKPYAWRELRFTVPKGLDDDTLVAFRGAGHSLTIARDALTGTIDAYARTQEQAVAAQRLPSYVADGPKVLDGTKAYLVDRTFADAQGAKVFQRQAFVALGKVVAIVTATARNAAIEKAKKSVVDVVQSLHVADR